MSVISLATTFVPGSGLAVAQLRNVPAKNNRRQWLLEYTVNQNLWQSHWLQTTIPSRGSVPLLVSLTADNEGVLIATVSYESGAVESARLTVTPRWYTVKQPHLTEVL